MSILGQKQPLSIIYHLNLPRPGAEEAFVHNLSCPGTEAAFVHNLSCPAAEAASVHNIPCPGTEAAFVYNLPCPGTETDFVLGQKQPLSWDRNSLVLGQKQPLCPSFTTLIYHVPGQNCMLNLPACFTGGSSSGGSSQCQDRLSNCADYGQNACVGQYVPWAKDNCPKTCNLCPSKQQGGGGE